VSEGPGVIEGDGIRIESSEETSEQMLAAVEPKKDEPTKFKAVKPEGEKEEKPKSAISEAASKLGKKGAQAAAKARAAKGEEEEAPEPEKAPEKPAKAEYPEEEDEPEEDTDPEVRKSRAAERVKQATREAAEAKRERDRLKAENEELRKARPAPAAEERKAPEPAKAPEKPKADTFENYEDYLDARDKWNRQEWSREESERAAQRAEREQVMGTVKTFQEAVSEAVAEDPGFWDKVPEIHDSTPLGQEIVRAGKHAPAILLHFAENPAEYKRISKISDLREVIREVGKIEDRMERATAGDSRSDDHPGSNPEISRARPPARPVAASPHIASGDKTGEPEEDAPVSAFVKADFGRRQAARR
jgi:hypothetical protein